MAAPLDLKTSQREWTTMIRTTISTNLKENS